MKDLDVDTHLLLSALFFPQTVCVLPQVHGPRSWPHLSPSRSQSGTTNNEARSGGALAGVDLHGAGDGLEGAVLEVVVGLLVQVAVLLAEALLEQLTLVPELDDRLGVGVEGGDGGRHAAGEGTPGHAGREKTKMERAFLLNRLTDGCRDSGATQSLPCYGTCKHFLSLKNREHNAETGETKTDKEQKSAFSVESVGRMEFVSIGFSLWGFSFIASGDVSSFSDGFSSDSSCTNEQQSLLWIIT